MSDELRESGMVDYSKYVPDDLTPEQREKYLMMRGIFDKNLPEPNGKLGARNYRAEHDQALAFAKGSLYSDVPRTFVPAGKRFSLRADGGVDIFDD